MRIGVDLDGVLYNWEKTARYMLREYKGHSRYGPMGFPITNWNYIEEHAGPADWKWLWNEGIELGLFRYGHCIRGAQLGVRALRAAGHKIEVVTHRPSAAVADTIAWLGLFQKPEAGVVFDGIHIITDGSRKSSSNVELLIDDKANNIEDMTGHGRRGILFSQPWNTGAKPAGSVRANDWPHVVELVKEINDSKVARDDRGTATDNGCIHGDACIAHNGRGAEASSGLEAPVGH